MPAAVARHGCTWSLKASSSPSILILEIDQAPTFLLRPVLKQCWTSHFLAQALVRYQIAATVRAYTVPSSGAKLRDVWAYVCPVGRFTLCSETAQS